MIGLEDRQTLVQHIHTAHTAGARLRSACEMAGISVRTFEGWQVSDGLTVGEKHVLHDDNGATLKATTVLAVLHWLGVKPSYSRPRVSDDNAFVESLFKTAKYRPEFPARSFADLESAHTWGQDKTSCAGTTLIIATAAFAMSPPLSAMQGKIRPSWLPVIRLSPGTRTQPRSLGREYARLVTHRSCHSQP